MLKCDKCEANIPEGAKFCPQCADPVTEADIVKSPAKINGPANVEISFGLSSSANYAQAKEICEKLPNYIASGEGKTTKHYVCLPITEVELIINIWDLVGNWKSSQMLIDGQKSTKSDLVYRGVGCYRNRQNSYNPNQYCFGEREYEYNIWGCRRMEMPIIFGEWLTFGKFDRSGIWYFDKDRIKQELERKIHENRLCPILNSNKILSTLSLIPDSINPKTSKKWSYRKEFKEVNGNFREVAVGVEPVLKKMNEYIIGEFKPTYKIEDNNSSSNIHRIELKIDSNEITGAKRSSKAQNTGGCVLPIISIIIFSVSCLILLN
ncbi:MAG: zinc ribbon domain-containing protein [Candidatus Lokiarchaeota archaeon]|nr:zinc ribbon domain-containing protein [Candidatus Lokiarchaeota archaeon]